MKFTSNLYIFALTVLCSPGFFIKYKTTHYILYSFVFTLVLYITFDFVNKYTENYEQYNVDVKGVDSLVDLIKTQGGDQKKIDINNQLFQVEGTNDANCWNALGKNQKELEIIKVQLDSYSGTKESTDTLNKQLNEQKKEIEILEEALKEFRGTKGEIDLINIQIEKYQDEIDDLKDKLFVYNQTEKTIGEVNKKIFKIQTNVTDLNTKISNCNTLNGKNQGIIDKLKNDIGRQELEMKFLQDRIDGRYNCIKKIRLKFRVGSQQWDGSGAVKYIYLTKNNKRVTNIVNVTGKYFDKKKTYYLEFTTDYNQQLDGLYIDVGNDGIRIDSIGIEKLVNGNWKTILNSYTPKLVWIKRRAYQFTFPSVVK